MAVYQGHHNICAAAAQSILRFVLGTELPSWSSARHCRGLGLAVCFREGCWVDGRQQSGPQMA